jgi:hypothetical protein
MSITAYTIRNRIISRKGAKAQRKKVVSELGVFVPWREEYPNPMGKEYLGSKQKFSLQTFWSPDRVRRFCRGEGMNL